MNELVKWEYSSNYLGEDYSNNYIVYSVNRDSDLLTQSNYDYLAKTFPQLKEVEFGHWLCGWVKQLLLPIDSKESLVSKILDTINGYPVFDEDDYYERESSQSKEDWIYIQEDIIDYLYERFPYINWEWCQIENLYSSLLDIYDWRRELDNMKEEDIKLEVSSSYDNGSTQIELELVNA